MQQIVVMKLFAVFLLRSTTILTVIALESKVTSTQTTVLAPVSILGSQYTKYKRSNLLPPRGGTINWELLNSKTTNSAASKFSPRHGHATTVFPCPDQAEGLLPKDRRLCLWLAGGRSEERYSFDLTKVDKNDDVWWSYDGATWTQVTNFNGDFIQGVGNHNAKKQSSTAPWYARFGHTLTSIDVDSDGFVDIMVLIGGYSPLFSHDVWISQDGINWYIDGYAPFKARAYHSAVSFLGSLWVLGGTPLTNDVWEGVVVVESSRKVGYTIQWHQRLAKMEAPWMPRAGQCAVVQTKREWDVNGPSSSELVTTEYLYVMGGYGGWPRDDPRHDGERGRNDVWRTTDGLEWESVLPPQGQTTMPWMGRSFHSCVIFHDPTEKSLRAGVAHFRDKEQVLQTDKFPPRIYLLGGGYFGRKGNNEVRKVEGYLDLWWTEDGSTWTQVNHFQGSTEYNTYSSNEWTSSTIDNEMWWKGKWGQTVESFYVEEDINGDGTISPNTTKVEVEIVNDRENPVHPRTLTMNEAQVPALFVIGGKHVGGTKTNNIFVSRPGLHCEHKGITCGKRGICGPGLMGCLCDKEEIGGDFCERGLTEEEIIDNRSSAFQSSFSITVITSQFIATTLFLIAFFLR